MNKRTRGGLSSFTRGSEIWMHQVRMGIRSFLTALAVGLVLGFLALVGWLYWKMPQVVWLGLKDNTIAHAKHFLSLDVNPMTVWNGAQWVSVAVKDAIGITQPYADMADVHLRNSLIVGALGAVLATGLIMIFWWSYGRGKMEDKSIRGAQIVEGKELASILRKAGEASPYTIAGIPMRAKSENLNMLFVGAQGVGKTQAFFHHMRQVRARGKRAIVYDPTGEFVEEFYRPGKDVLLNPMDSRCAWWTVWNDIEEEYHFDALANALIPSPPDDRDPFWAKAGRHVLKDAYKVLGRENKRTNRALYNAIAKSNLDALHLLLQGEAGATYVDPKTERTGMSLKMTVQNQLESFRFLPDSGDPFSIRRFIAEDSDSWLFFSCPASMREALSPVLSLWVELVVKSVLDLPPIHAERMWLYIDEVPTLQKLDSLALNVTNTRKYGLCTVLGVQDFDLFYSIYGMHSARTIISGCQTKFLMRVTDGEAAEMISKAIGEDDVDERDETLSYGHQAQRDGVSVRTQRNLRKVVLPSQIMRLPDMAGYLIVPGEYPVAKVKMRFEKPAQNQPAFIRRKGNDGLYGPAVASAAAGGSNPGNAAQAPDAHLSEGVPSHDAPAGENNPGLQSVAPAAMPASDTKNTAPLRGVLSPKRAPAGGGVDKSIL